METQACQLYTSNAKCPPRKEAGTKRVMGRLLKLQKHHGLHKTVLLTYGWCSVGGAKQTTGFSIAEVWCGWKGKRAKPRITLKESYTSCY